MEAQCPSCGATVELDDSTEVGELLDCGECGSELEVVKLNPPTLAEAPEEEEDWGE